MDDLLKPFQKRNPEIKDYDDLTTEEKDTYLEMIRMVESSAITIEDFKRYVHKLRQGIELEVSQIHPTDPKFFMYQARMYVYILFEAFFERPQRAKDMIQQLANRPKI